MGVGGGARGDAAASVAAAGCHVSHAEDDGIVAPAVAAASSHHEAAQLIAEGRARGGARVGVGGAGGAGLGVAAQPLTLTEQRVRPASVARGIAEGLKKTEKMQNIEK